METVLEKAQPSEPLVADIKSTLLDMRRELEGAMGSELKDIRKSGKQCMSINKALESIKRNQTEIPVLTSTSEMKT